MEESYDMLYSQSGIAMHACRCYKAIATSFACSIPPFVSSVAISRSLADELHSVVLAIASYSSIYKGGQRGRI